ncbi:MAG: HD domain-containing protein [Vallitaleaceae bacterium]|nr:HD domain-containing protein [Vallitaleaceae bacterium]
MNERINKIIKHPKYQEWLQLNTTCEVDRSFCKHQMRHFLDTARIAYILNLEQKWNLSKEVIYAAALLHDIGRWEQYQSDIPHNESSARLCVDVLKDSDFNEEEIEAIVKAILNHTIGPVDSGDRLSVLLFTADKKSRTCFNCDVRNECDWSHQKMNLEIHY